MAELLVEGITELPYRECATKISEMTGQTISAMVVWNVIQVLGEKVCEEEKIMGTMENHVWSVIARRMKHSHTSWSRRGIKINSTEVEEGGLKPTYFSPFLITMKFILKRLISL